MVVDLHISAPVPLAATDTVIRTSWRIPCAAQQGTCHSSDLQRVGLLEAVQAEGQRAIAAVRLAGLDKRRTPLVGGSFIALAGNIWVLLACCECCPALLREVERPGRFVLEISDFATNFTCTTADFGGRALDHPVVRALSLGLQSYFDRHI